MKTAVARLNAQHSTQADLSFELDEAETIISKKREEQVLQRQVADQQRRLRESEELKAAAELKRRRDKEDLRIQKEIQLKRLRQEEARRRAVEDRRLEEARQKEKYEAEMKNLLQLDKLRNMMADKEKKLEEERRQRHEVFRRQKEEYYTRLGSKSPANPMEMSAHRSSSLQASASLPSIAVFELGLSQTPPPTLTRNQRQGSAEAKNSKLSAKMMSLSKTQKTDSQTEISVVGASKPQSECGKEEIPAAVIPAKEKQSSNQLFEPVESREFQVSDAEIPKAGVEDTEPVKEEYKAKEVKAQDTREVKAENLERTETISTSKIISRYELFKFYFITVAI